MSRPRLPSAEWAARREAILRATADEIAANGIAALTLEAVAHRARVSKGAVQYAFGSKDELLAALGRWTVTTFVSRGIGRSPELEQEGFLDMVDDLIEGLAGEESRLLVMLLLVAEAPRQEWARRPLAEYYVVANAKINPAFAAALRAADLFPEASDEDLVLIAQGVRSLILGTYLHWAAGGAAAISSTDVANQIRRLLVLLLRPDDRGLGAAERWASAL